VDLVQVFYEYVFAVVCSGFVVPAPDNDTSLRGLLPGDPASAAVVATVRWLSDYQLTMVHVAAAAFLAAIVLLSGCVCVQYGHRYRKYQLAAAKEDLESLTENEGMPYFSVKYDLIYSVIFANV